MKSRRESRVSSRSHTTFQRQVVRTLGLISALTLAWEPAAGAAGTRPDHSEAQSTAVVTMRFTTGAGGHTGSDDINVNIPPISVSGGYAIMNPGEVLQVDKRFLDSSLGAKSIHLGYANASTPVYGSGSCSGSGGSMWLEGSGTESVVALNSNQITQSYGIHGTVRLVISDGGASDEVQAYFTPDPGDPNVARAVSGLVFDAPITRGTIVASCGGCGLAAPAAITVDPASPVGKFIVDLAFDGQCACCEYRQYVRNRSSMFGFIPYGVWDDFSEDVDATGLRRGHRSDAETPGDVYTPDRATGCFYHGADTPHQVGCSLGLWFRREFKATLHHCSSLTEDFLAQWAVCLRYPMIPIPSCDPTSCGTGVSLLGTTEATRAAAADTFDTSSDRGTTIVFGASYETPSLAAEQKLEVDFGVRGDSLGLVAIGRGGLDSLTEAGLLDRARSATILVDGLQPIALPVGAAEGANASTTDGYTWSKVALFQWPPSHPDPVHVRITGLGNPIEFDHRMSRGTTAVPAPAPVRGRAGIRPEHNPASGPVAFACTLPEAGLWRARILDVGGRVVRDLGWCWYPAGVQRLNWRADDGNGAPVAAGMYYARIDGPHGQAVTRVVVIPR